MNEKYEPMYCPVCENFYFSELQDGDDPKDFQCLSCGWKYDLCQVSSPDIPDERNGKSLNEYRIWYKIKITEDPRYYYLDETLPAPVPHICPVCGKHHFKDVDSYDICPICGWEDDGSEENPDDVGANDLSYHDYKQRYLQKLYVNPDYHWKSDK